MFEDQERDLMHVQLSRPIGTIAASNLQNLERNRDTGFQWERLL